MFLEKINNYEIFRPKCDSFKEVLHSIATLDTDISPVLPYLNAELGGWDYDRDNQVLLLKLSPGKWITLHPQEIAIRGARDLEESHALLAWIKARSTRFMSAGGDHAPLHRPGRTQDHGNLEAAAHDQLQSLRLRYLHGLCRGPPGRGNPAGGLPTVNRGEVSGEAVQSSRPIWTVSAGGRWMMARARGMKPVDAACRGV